MKLDKIYINTLNVEEWKYLRETLIGKRAAIVIWEGCRRHVLYIV